MILFKCNLDFDRIQMSTISAYYCIFYYENQSYDLEYKISKWFLYEMQHWVKIAMNFQTQVMMMISCTSYALSMTVFATANPVMRILLNFPPEYFSDLSW